LDRCDRGVTVVDVAVVKRSVSFDEQLLAEVTAEVGQGEVSATVNQALADLLRRRRALAAVAEWEAEHGVFTEDEMAEAHARLDAAGVPDLRR
jgi:hypothetical protein